ncbi:MAG: L,D-transpeptidase, partial [Saprospiraceae bacterium]
GFVFDFFSNSLKIENNQTFVNPDTAVGVAKIDYTGIPTGFQKVTLKINNAEDLDGQIETYLRDIYPVISNKAVEEIQSSKSINKFITDAQTGAVDIYLNFNVPLYYLEDRPDILWELNLPQFESSIFQIYNNDTILIDTWPNVIGKPSTKTYTGNYAAFRLRNWPTWKDPEAEPESPATPPGPGNPLGLFVVHYDENSLRYLHGTNKNGLLKNEYRALSHGCVRNLNENVAKLKSFVCKRIVRSKDLTWWINSKKSMIYELSEEDKFPVRIIYKLFDVNKDEFGMYVVFFKDVYGYSRGASYSKFDDPNLFTFISPENIFNELKKEYPTYKADDKLLQLIPNLAESHTDYQKYYFDDILNDTTGK